MLEERGLGYFAPTLSRLAKSFASGTGSAFAEAAQEIQRVFAVDFCSIYSYVPAPLSLLSRVAAAGSGVLAPAVLPVRPNSYLGQVLTSEEPLLLDNAAVQGEPFLCPDTQAVAGMRTTYGGESNGAVFLSQRGTLRVWTKSERLALETIASQVGTALAYDGLQQVERQQWQQAIAANLRAQQEAALWQQNWRQLEEHNRLLVKITAGYPAKAILQEVCWLGTTLIGETCGMAVLPYDPEGECFRYSAIAHLPGAYVASTEGYGLEPGGTPWSEAARHECFLAYGDLRQAPLHEWYRLAAVDSGFCACWSLPVFSEFGELLAAIALHHPIPRLPSPALRQSLEKLGFLVRAVLERDRLRQQWQAEKAAAEESNRQKSRFLAHINHELRTPLNAIVGYTQLLLRDPHLSAAEQREYLEAIEHSGTHLQQTIDNVLELCKIEAGHLELRRDAFSLRDTLSQLMSIFRGTAKEKGLALRLTVAADVPDGRVGDSGKLAQVLVNLLGNAVKFTQKGWVAIAVQRGKTNEQVILQVEDTGPGIAAAELPNLFQPFVQATVGRQMGQGSGLGLAIAHQLITCMGGTLQVVSTVNQGTRFTVELPLAIAPAAPAAAAVPQLEIPLPQGSARVLIADDCPSSRHLLRKLLTSLGLQVREAVNGQEALAIWEVWQPQLILLDLNMPERDGYDTVATIRQKQTSYPVVIAVSASTGAENRARAIAAGCDDFVSKPFRMEAIVAAIRKHLLPINIVDITALDMEELVTVLQVAAPNWVPSLRDAAIVGDLKAMRSVLETLPPMSPRYRQILTALVEELRFDYLFALAEQALQR
ncbi:MAG: hybrid sensor histidine kinase/response regulator [Pseudanabaenaceae cyanobacterium]